MNRSHEPKRIKIVINPPPMWLWIALMLAMLILVADKLDKLIARG